MRRLAAFLPLRTGVSVREISRGDSELASTRFMRCTSEQEDALRREGYSLVAGADEAGRGALFGPVYAAAVILDPGRPVRGLADSKTLSPERREELASTIRANALTWAVGSADAAEIDLINIYQASRLAMKRAVEALLPAPDFLLIDALTLEWPGPQRGIIKGDAQVECIAAASILAKTSRDACMREMDRRYPGYGLARHKGYPTREHQDALRRLGVTDLHRKSYAPVAAAAQVAR
jgi:ribonuclease HII